MWVNGLQKESSERHVRVITRPLNKLVKCFCCQLEGCRQVDDEGGGGRVEKEIARERETDADRQHVTLPN